MRSDGQGGQIYRLGLLRSTNYGAPGSFVRMGLFTQVATGNLAPYVQGGYPVPGNAQVAVDPTNPLRVYALFNDRKGEEDPNTGDADVDVYLARSDDGGVSWVDWGGPPDPKRLRINNDSTKVDVRRDQFLARMWVDGRGRVHIMWYDTRRLSKPWWTQYYDIDLFYTWSDESEGWDFSLHQQNLEVAIRPAQLTFEGTAPFIGDYNGITSAVDSAGRTVVTLVYMRTPPINDIDGGEDDGVDPVDTNENIFLRRVVFNP